MISFKIILLFAIFSVCAGGKVGPRVQRMKIPRHLKYKFNYTLERQEETWMKAANVYAFTVKDIYGETVPMSKYRGKVLLIVNVASKSNLTGLNYAMMQSLHKRYRNRGLAVLAFPCNQFLNQEPGTNEEIAEFAKEKKLRFTMFSKINVNGNDACPLWKYLKLKSRHNAEVKSSFTKFIVDRRGRVIRRISTVSVKLVEKVVSPYFKRNITLSVPKDESLSENSKARQQQL